MVFKQRLNDLKSYDTVQIYVYELKKLGCDNGPLLFHLKKGGEIWYDHKGNFKALRDGPVDPLLLDRTKKRPKIRAELTPLHVWMRDQLHHVELPAPAEDVPVYFKTFIEHRREQIDMFFTVDSFAGRVHTPVVNLKGNLRPMLRLCGEPIVSLDVKQMQPTILAKVLFDSIGSNSFSKPIFDGEDVYVILQRSAGLATRPEAKKLLFQLIFGKPKDDIKKLFSGETKWVAWINDYKKRIEPNNPHKESKHTNLAWLLQYSEVQVMTSVWQALMDAGIPFLTIHDDVLCRSSDKLRVYHIIDRELKGHFARFTITITESGEKEERLSVTPAR